jgi:hypothetical protein
MTFLQPAAVVALYSSTLIHHCHVCLASFRSAYGTLHATTISTDSNAPTWANNMDGQVNLRDANRRTIVFDAPNGKQYRLRPDNELATLLVSCCCCCNRLSGCPLLAWPLLASPLLACPLLACGVVGMSTAAFCRRCCRSCFQDKQRQV